MNNHEKPYSHPRWHSPLGGKGAKVTKGTKKLTEEEKKNEREVNEFLKNIINSKDN